MVKGTCMDKIHSFYNSVYYVIHFQILYTQFLLMKNTVATEKKLFPWILSFWS
jgi:hypothetical protein